MLKRTHLKFIIVSLIGLGVFAITRPTEFSDEERVRNELLTVFEELVADTSDDLFDQYYTEEMCIVVQNKNTLETIRTMIETATISDVTNLALGTSSAPIYLFDNDSLYGCDGRFTFRSWNKVYRITLTPANTKLVVTYFNLVSHNGCMDGLLP